MLGKVHICKQGVVIIGLVLCHRLMLTCTAEAFTRKPNLSQNLFIMHRQSESN